MSCDALLTYPRMIPCVYDVKKCQSTFPQVLGYTVVEYFHSCYFILLLHYFWWDILLNNPQHFFLKL